MKLYLMRHCLTDDGPQMDAARPLDDVGRKQAKVMRKFLKRAQVKPDVIITSPFERTKQTAEAMQRGDTPIKFAPALEPDGDPSKALKAILKLAGSAESDNPENPSVLVVTHGPLIQQILAAVAFNFHDEKWNFEHGSIAYINTSESRFRWIVTPKLAAHIVGKNPKKVEPQEARAVVRLAYNLTEHLLKLEKAAALEPLITRFRKIAKVRWTKQRTRVVKAIRNTASLSVGPLDYGMLKQFAGNALRGTDDNFLSSGAKVRGYAYELGASHVSNSLVKPIEAKRKKDDIAPILAAMSELPGAPNDYLPWLETELDNTSVSRVEDAIDAAAADGASLDQVVTAVQQEIASWYNAPADQVSRAETVALDAISKAYHAGSSDLARLWKATAGETVEKHWDAQPDACETCLANEADDWIPDDAWFGGSGDFEPPAHPNCRCSISYRVAVPEEVE